MAYCNWVVALIFGANGSRNYEPDAAGSMSAANLKEFITKYGQACEQIRIDDTHSMTYISCTDSESDHNSGGFHTICIFRKLFPGDLV